MVLEKGHGVRETARLLGISRTTLVGCVKEVREHEEAVNGHLKTRIFGQEKPTLLAIKNPHFWPQKI